MKLLIFSRGESVTHIKIHNKDDMLNLCGGESFPSLSDLVQFYMENPDQLQEKNGGTIVLRLVFLLKSLSLQFILILSNKKMLTTIFLNSYSLL